MVTYYYEFYSVMLSTNAVAFTGVSG